jgi:hypothetical protein
MLNYLGEVSDKCGKALFISSGTMASALLNIDKILNQKGLESIFVETVTLKSLVSKFAISEVNVIKADIEGAEILAFRDKEFFANFNPRILIEPITHSGANGGNTLLKLLASYGYTHKWHSDKDSRVPLICFEGN